MEELAWGRRKNLPPGRLERRKKRSTEIDRNVVGTGKLRQLSFYGFKFLIKIRDVVCQDRGALGLNGRDLKRALEIRTVPEERGRDGLQSTS